MPTFNSAIWNKSIMHFSDIFGASKQIFQEGYFMVCISLPNMELPISPTGLSWRSQQWVAPFLHRDFHQPHGGVVPEPKGWCYWCLVVFEVGWWLVRSNDGSCHHFQNRRTKLCAEKSWWGWVLIFVCAEKSLHGNRSAFHLDFSKRNQFHLAWS